MEKQQTAVSGKIVTHNEKIGSKIMTFSEKVSLPLKELKQNNQEKSKIQKQYSWKLGSRPSLKRKKSRGSADSEAVPLNNGRDHSQCNGNGVTRQVCT